MSNDKTNNKRLNEAMAGMAVLVEELLISKGAVISDLRGRLAVAEGQAKDARASTDVACRQVDEARRVLGLEVNVGLLDGLRRVISKQLAESQKVEPVSYADEFEAAEDMAELRRERCVLQKRAERAEEALGAADAVIASVTGALAGEPQKPGYLGERVAELIYLGERVAELMRERDEALARSEARMEMIETMESEFESMKARRYEAAKKADEYLKERDEARASCGDIAAERDLLRAWQLDAVSALGSSDPSNAMTRIELLVGDLEAEKERSHGDRAAAAQFRKERDEAIEKAEALREKLEGSRAAVRDFNTLIGRLRRALGVSAGGSLDDAVAAQRRELLDLRSRVELGTAENRRLVEAAESQGRTIAKIQVERDEARAQAEAALAESEAARKDLTDLCMLVSDGEHSSFVLAFQQAQEMKAETKAAQEELTHLKTECATLRTDSGRALQRDRESLRVIDDIGNALGCADDEDVIAKAKAVAAERAEALQDVSVLRATTKVQEAERDALAAELKATQDRLEQAKAGRIAEWDKTTGALKARINSLTRELKAARAHAQGEEL